MMKTLSVTFISLVALSALAIAQERTKPAPPDLTKPLPDMEFDKSKIASMSADQQTECFRISRESLAADPFRPLYHLSPPGFGFHDPAGLCWWQGKYHLFYLRTKTPKITWGRGHAVSEDLVHWQDLPMVPADLKGGTGQVWVDDDRVIMGLAAPSHKQVSLHTASDPLLVDWVAHPGNPVYTPGNDNYIWREGNTYYMTIRKHAFEPDRNMLSGRTTLELLRSDDLATWKLQGTFLEDGDYTEPGEDCACNNVLPIGAGKHVILFFSHRRGAQYYIGTFDREKGRFHIENHGRMNHGPNGRAALHAPSGFIDPKGRCIGMWNVIENRHFLEGWEDWDQVMSLPRELSLIEKCSFFNPLGIEPIAELRSLRFDPVRIKDVAIPANGEKVLPGVNGKAMELEVVIDPMKAREVGINILRSPHREEQTTITLFMHGWVPFGPSSSRELAIDVSRASLDPRVSSRSPEIGPLHLEDGEPLRLRVFIDRSVVEVFANGRQCLTLRTYPTREDSNGVSVFARGSEAKLVLLTAYQMRSIWPELKHNEGR